MNQKKRTKVFLYFCPLPLRSNQKIGALYTTNLRILFWLLHYFFDLTSVYKLEQKYKNISVRFSVQIKTLIFAFEIYWPLGKTVLLMSRPKVGGSLNPLAPTWVPTALMALRRKVNYSTWGPSRTWEWQGFFSH